MQKNFNKLQTQYQDFMYHIAYEILNDSLAAELAMEMAFARIHNTLPGIKKPESTITRQLIGIVINKAAVDIYHQRKKQTAGKLPVLNHPIGDAIENNVNMKCIASLPAKYTDIMLLKYAHGCRTKTISGLLGVSPMAIYCCLLKGKWLLQKELRKNDIHLKRLY